MVNAMDMLITPFMLFFGFLWKLAPVDTLPVAPPAEVAAIAHPAALPSPRDLPENLFALFVAEYPQGALPAPIEVQFADVLNRRTSITLAATVNAQNLPDGIVIFLEGDFNAVDFMARFSEEMKREKPELIIGDSPLGKTLMLIEPPGQSPYGPLKNGFALMLEAVSPNTLRLSSSGARDSLRAGRSLAPGSDFAALLVPDRAMPRRALITPFNTILNAAIDEMAKGSGSADEAAKLKQIVFKPLLGVKSFRGEGRVISSDSVSASLMFESASPDAALELQELFFGYKMMLNTFLTAEAPKDFPDVLKTLLSSIKITVDGSATTMNACITTEQVKAITRFGVKAPEQESVTRSFGLLALLLLWL